MTTNGSADTGGKQELRRDVTVWGSYTWGYADVGADIYAALGLVIAAAEGLAPLAFALAGVIYILIGLGYTELSSTYPVAGGGHYFALRGLGDFWDSWPARRCYWTIPSTSRSLPSLPPVISTFSYRSFFTG